ncbi:exocyst complex component Sec10-domain-containing protein [Umbelopsis sp. AD052]|nr:exocyst complex component Sec10-domain-containing protein [Umbelopsis sp. AD052]
MKNKNLRPALAPPVCCHYHPDFRTLYSIFAQYMLMADVTLLSDESPSCSIPTINPQTLSASRFLPPDTLIHIFKYLPISATRNVALCSRRFKVLVYDDEIWDAKLRLLGIDTPITLSTEEVQAAPTTGKTNLSLMGTSSSLYINNKPLNELIPGLKLDPFTARARARSTGKAREIFSQFYTRLYPFYVDLRHASGESMVLSEYGSEPEECGRILSKLVGLGKCKVVDDWSQLNDQVEKICRYFENACLHEFEVAYDDQDVEQMQRYATALVELNGGQSCIQTFIQKHSMFYDNPFQPDANFKSTPPNFQPFQEFMKAISEELKVQASVIHDVFPPKADVYYIFADRVFEDVIADYLGIVLERARAIDLQLYLKVIASSLDSCLEFVDILTSETLPSRLEDERAKNILFKLFLPLMDDYLHDEIQYVKLASEKYINKWKASTSGMQGGPSSTTISNQNRESFKRKYLSAFKKIVSVPVELVSSAATSISSPFHRESKGGHSPDVSISTTAVANSEPNTPTDSPSSTPTINDEKDDKRLSTATLTNDEVGEKKKTQVDNVRKRSSSHTGSRPNSMSSVRSDNELNNAMHELDALQHLLSLELCLQLIHVNKDAEHRVQRFVKVGFPGRLKTDIQKCAEHVFTDLLKIMGPMHIKPGFDRAATHLAKYTPQEEGETRDRTDVAPLAEFFELVHIADLIQQMIEVYWKEEMNKIVDKHDFLNEVNKEKKSFERLLDDCVAQGMDQGIQVLIAQVQYILTTEQKPSDYNPSPNEVTDLKPSKACRDTIDCLKNHTEMLKGSVEKETMNIFYQEVGKRFYECLCKHIKSQTISEQGGFQIISDVNAYDNYILSLRQRTITPYFAALKALANIYIISNPSDIKDVIHDLERYHGILRIEDLFEFAACRSDWPTIRRTVQKDMTDCNIM